MSKSTVAPGSTNGNHRDRPWRVLVLLLAATAVGATESAGSATEPSATATESVALAAAPSAHATEPVAHPAEAVTGAAGPVAHAPESGYGAGRSRMLDARPRIGRIFFTPAERRSRHSGGEPVSMSAATPDPPPAPSSSRIPARERLVVNGALSSSTRGRAVWVNGNAVEDSAHDKSAWTDRNGNVWLVNGDQGIRLLQPGQSIDRSGVIEDLLPPGAVTRR
jgi:hypothetical protein